MAILTVRDRNGNPIEIPALQGKTGKTAYQYAQEGGYEGTENEFMELLAKAANNSKVEVSYKQTLEGGIKIGHLIVDGVTTDICAPAAGESVGDGNDNQTIMGNGTAFDDNAAVNLVGSGATTITADTSNNKITIHTPGADGNTQFTTYIGALNEKTNAATTNGNTYLKLAEDDGTVKSQYKISGSGATTVTSDESGNITINTPVAEDTQVTSVDGHYEPEEDATKVLSVDASSTVSANWGSTDLVTGVNIQRDAKGHVTGVTVDSIQMPTNPVSNLSAVQYVEQNLNDSQKAQARTNIGAVDGSYVTNQLNTLKDEIVSESKEFTVQDKDGNIVAKINENGLTVTEVSAQSLWVNGVDVVSKIPNVVDSLDSDSANDALSAAQGKALKEAIDSITGDIGDLGGGDMMKASYDMNNNGIVDNAEKLQGYAATDFMLKSTYDADGDNIVDRAKKIYADYKTYNMTTLPGTYVGPEGINLGGALATKPDLTTYYTILKLDSSLGKFSANYVDITGGNISEVGINDVTISDSAISGGTINNSAISNGTITAGTIAGINISNYGLSNNINSFMGDWCLAPYPDTVGYESFTASSNFVLSGSDTSPVIMFAGNGIKTVSGTDFTNAANNTEKLNLYITQSGLVKAKQILCNDENSIIGVATTSGNAYMTPYAFVARNNLSSVSGSFTGFGANWKSGDTIVGNIRTNSGYMTLEYKWCVANTGKMYIPISNNLAVGYMLTEGNSGIVQLGATYYVDLAKIVQKVIEQHYDKVQ